MYEPFLYIYEPFMYVWFDLYITHEELSLHAAAIACFNTVQA